MKKIIDAYDLYRRWQANTDGNIRLMQFEQSREDIIKRWQDFYPDIDITNMLKDVSTNNIMPEAIRATISLIRQARENSEK